MPALQLVVAELERELEALGRFARPFLDPEGPTKLERFRGQLRPLLNAGGGTWSIPRNDPVRSSPTNKYSHGRGEEVWAEVSCAWDLTRVERTQAVVMSGIASTCIELRRRSEEETQSLGIWRMEVGDDNSPGCYFHAQIMGQDDRPPFPNWLAIPRLPSLILTPASSIEFVLSELFQDDWLQATRQKRDDLDLWGALQKERMHGWLAWQQRIVDAHSFGVLPWTNLKRAKPDEELVSAVRGAPLPHARVGRRRRQA
jgi:hypothetical protein